MAENHIYLSMAPPSLIMSMLQPAEFGQYLSVGTSKRAHGQAIYFDIKEGFESDYFDLEGAKKECVPHPNGQVKHTVYVGIYRALEHIPLNIINNLYLTTRDGRILKLEQGVMPTTFTRKYHLYDEISPVNPLIVSALNPPDFCNFITNPSNRMHVPKIFFADIQLPNWVKNPTDVADDELYSPKIEHFRDCLVDMIEKKKETKTVDRTHTTSEYLTWQKNGFYVGDQSGVLYFPFPSNEDLRKNHYEWWKSANL